MTEIATAVQSLRSYFATGKTRPIEWRRRQLERLVAFLKERESEDAAQAERDA